MEKENTLLLNHAGKDFIFSCSFFGLLSFKRNLFIIGI